MHLDLRCTIIPNWYQLNHCDILIRQRPSDILLLAFKPLGVNVLGLNIHMLSLCSSNLRKFWFFEGEFSIFLGW